MHKYYLLLQNSSEKIAIFGQSLKKQRLLQMANDVKKVRQAGSYELTQINSLIFPIKRKRALLDPYG